MAISAKPGVDEDEVDEEEWLTTESSSDDEIPAICSNVIQPRTRNTTISSAQLDEKFIVRMNMSNCDESRTLTKMSKLRITDMNANHTMSTSMTTTTAAGTVDEIANCGGDQAAGNVPPAAAPPPSQASVVDESNYSGRSQHGGDPTLEETQSIAQLLFHEQIRNGFQTNGVQNTEPLEEFLDHDRPAAGMYSRIILRQVSHDLRNVAQSFERSNERESIRRSASQVPLDVTHEEFVILLEELFRGGITRERIAVLFFFCTDVALREYNSASGFYHFRLLKWSMLFIRNFVCNWVQRQGGWEVVLCNYAPRLTATVLALLTCTALAIYIKKNI